MGSTQDKNLMTLMLDKAIEYAKDANEMLDNLKNEYIEKDKISSVIDIMKNDPGYDWDDVIEDLEELIK